MIKIIGPALTLFLLTISTISTAQNIDTFPEDTTAFIEQFEKYLRINIKEADEKTVETFINLWTTGQFTKNQRSRIIKISNFLLDHNARRHPHFFLYIENLIVLKSNNIDTIKYNQWESSIYHIINENDRPLRLIQTFLTNTHLLFAENTINRTYSVKWKIDSTNYEIRHTANTVQFTFDETNLFCLIKKDSMCIRNTKGIYDAVNLKWMGKGGIVTWERAGYNKDEVFAELKDYEIDLTKSSYRADSVLFTNTIYLDEPMLGSFHDQVVHIIQPEKAIYPEFISYKKEYFIEGMYKNIDYYGGLYMKGANLIGTGDEMNKARLLLKNPDTVFMKAIAETFMFNKSRAVSNGAKISIYIQNDSIYHPGIMFSYSILDEELSLNQSDKVISKSSYFDSYHQVSMKFDRLLWKNGDDNIYFTMSRIGSIGNAVFTSSNFYNLQDFEAIQGRDWEHPLAIIRNLAKQKGENTFTSGELANFMMYPVHQIRQMMMFLTIDGFIFYDVDKDVATINQKLYDYLDARLGEIDYDVIRIGSRVNRPNHNGILNLDTFSLAINGVERIFLSDSQNVVIYPSDREIIMNKNRNFDFGGVVNAGLFTFFGDGFSFDYEKFAIELNRIDSVRLQVQTDKKDMYGSNVLVHVQNTIEQVTGNLLIDDSQNKSGLQNFPQYPVFNSKENCYVFYDDPNIWNGIYTRDKFYFEVAPFTIDSLDNFSTQGLNFDGTFYSSDIFPPFENKLYLQPDNSLGFIRSTPEEGFPLYQGKGKFFKKVDLSNRGLRGAGIMEYLTSSSETEDIIFFPDSTTIITNDFSIAQRTEGIEYPDLITDEVKITWFPYEDAMDIRQLGQPFSMYGGKAKFSGMLSLNPRGLTGNGSIDLDKAILNSSDFEFNANDFDADTADFQLKNIDKTDFSFITDKINASIDFTTQKGDFESIGSYALAEFPENLYLSYLDNFTWEMTKNQLEINSDPQIDTADISPDMEKLIRLKDGDLPGAIYLSKHRSQDSLRFSSTKAIFDVTTSQLSATEVEYIKVADSRVIPEEGDVAIGKLAKMEMLNNSILQAGEMDDYHTIYNGKINILGRNELLGTGDYTYLDENLDSQIIHFTSIRIDSSLQTVAEGELTDEDDFTLSPVYKYKGKVKLNARRENLTFIGGVLPDQECSYLAKNFVYFESEIDPDSIYIPVSNSMRSYMNRGIHVGPYITKDSSHIYSRFLTPRRDPADEPLITATGYLHYDKNANRYSIAEKYKLDDRDTAGSIVNLQKSFCLLSAQGKYNLGIDLGQIKMNPAGSFSHDLEKNKAKVDLLLPVDFFFSNTALDTMVADILSNPGLKNYDIDKHSFKWKMNELIGEDLTNQFIQGINYFLFSRNTEEGADITQTKLELPKVTKHTMILGDVKMDWRTSSGSYLLMGKIALVTVNNRPVNKYVDAYMEILKRRSGDIWRLYISLPNGNYYYFSYTRAVMQTLSNNKDYIAVIDDVRKNKRKMKVKEGTKYKYLIATNSNLGQFLRRIEKFKEEEKEKEKQQEVEDLSPKKQDALKDSTENISQENQ